MLFRSAADNAMAGTIGGLAGMALYRGMGKTGTGFGTGTGGSTNFGFDPWGTGTTQIGKLSQVQLPFDVITTPTSFSIKN